MGDETDKSRIDQLLEFLQEDPDDHFSLYALALEYKSGGRVEEAVAALEQLRGRAPTYVPTYYQLAMCLMDLGRERDALDAAVAGIPLARAAGNLKTVTELEALAAQIRDASA